MNLSIFWIIFTGFFSPGLLSLPHLKRDGLINLSFFKRHILFIPRSFREVNGFVEIGIRPPPTCGRPIPLLNPVFQFFILPTIIKLLIVNIAQI